jgi:hypothetical protein
MDATHVQHLFDTYGYENLIFISLNNNRRLHVDDKMREVMVWDHERELLILEDDNYVLHEMRDFAPRKVTVAQDYSMLEAMIFAREPKYRI